MTHLIKTGTFTCINPEKGFRIHLIVFLLTTPAIWLIWYLTSTSYPWPVWHTSAWITDIVFHYLGVFVFKRSRKNQQ